jgi:hypothetical protein
MSADGPTPERLQAMLAAVRAHAFDDRPMGRAMALEVFQALLTLREIVVAKQLEAARRATGKRAPKEAARSDLVKAQTITFLLSTPTAEENAITTAEAVQAIVRCEPDKLAAELENYANRNARLALAQVDPAMAIEPVVEPDLVLAVRACRLILRVRRMREAGWTPPKRRAPRTLADENRDIMETYRRAKYGDGGS